MHFNRNFLLLNLIKILTDKKSEILNFIENSIEGIFKIQKCLTQ